ncbi:MAG: nucleoside triphosphate pyrophosphohydrolase, partial [Planctomycetes bacterium]|nr:nucleoside triphosphate pyrophosphohydrolase [Planctomycetota bacterium]
AKAARVGYDFPVRDMLFDKLREEISELSKELYHDGQIPERAASVDVDVEPDPPPFSLDQQKKIENELGDVLFVVANIARRWHINPEEALRASNAKFERRVKFIEQQLKKEGRSMEQVSLQEQEAIYQFGKRLEKTVETKADNR